jgi:hypothetical protein
MAQEANDNREMVEEICEWITSFCAAESRYRKFSGAPAIDLLKLSEADRRSVARMNEEMAKASQQFSTNSTVSLA